MIYIAYKYTNTPDKDALRKHLETISQVFEAKGEKTFILLRDKKKWGMKSHRNKLHSALFMVYKLIFAKHVVAFVDHEGSSPGLDFELRYAKFLGKQITLLIDEKIADQHIRSKVNHVVEFSNHGQLAELKPKLNSVLKYALAPTSL